MNRRDSPSIIHTPAMEVTGGEGEKYVEGGLVVGLGSRGRGVRESRNGPLCSKKVSGHEVLNSEVLGDILCSS